MIQFSKVCSKLCMILFKMQSNLSTTLHELKPAFKSELSVCVPSWLSKQTAEHVWGEKHAGCHETVLSCRSVAYMKRQRPQHPSLSLSSCRFSPSQPHHASLTRHLIWLLSARPLGLWVWFCLNSKLHWQPVATQNQFSGTRWFTFLCPNSCLGPFNGWSNILIVR